MRFALAVLTVIGLFSPLSLHAQSLPREVLSLPPWESTATFKPTLDPVSATPTQIWGCVDRR